MTTARKLKLAGALEKLGHLMMWGTPILDAMDVTADECPDKTLAEVIRRMRARIARGKSMFPEEAKQIPRSVQLILGAGETTGKFPRSCLISAQVLRAESA
jgi:type II secretory pathway component PulF